MVEDEELMSMATEGTMTTQSTRKTAVLQSVGERSLISA